MRYKYKHIYNHVLIFSAENLFIWLLVTSLLQATSSRVYHVIPDGHHPTSDNTYTLQHYLNNTSKYFTSNVQLHFLPGQYLLNSDLIISYISNFSLVGNISDGEVHTIINCTSPAAVVVENSENILISNFVMRDCMYKKSYTVWEFIRFGFHLHPVALVKNSRKTVFIINSVLVTISHFHSLSTSYTEECRVHFRNAQKQLVLSNITSNCIMVEYTNALMSSPTSHNITIMNFKAIDPDPSKYSVQILNEVDAHINVTVCESHFHNPKSISFDFDYCVGECTISIIRCVFSPIEMSLYSINTITINTLPKNSDCDISVTILHCIFQHYQGREYDEKQNDIINFVVENYYSEMVKPTLVIKNSLFQSITDVHSVIIVENAFVYFRDFVMFSNITNVHCIIAISKGYLQIHNYTEIKNSSVYALTCIKQIYIEENTMLHIAFNNVTLLFSLPTDDPHPKLFKAASPIDSLVSPCLFQYLSKQGNLDNYTLQNTKLTYHILLHHNLAKLFAVVKYIVTHCSWIPNTAFAEVNSKYVSQQVIQFYKNNFTLEVYKQICLCEHRNKSNCHQDELSPVYPGQTVAFQFILVNSLSKGILQIEDRPDHACRSHDKPFVGKITDKQCISINFTIQHNKGGLCELYTTVNKIFDVINLFQVNKIPLTFPVKKIPFTYPIYAIEGDADIFYVPLQPCPKGFSLSSSGYCQCDPVLSHILVALTCNINDGTVPRPASSWISANTINNIHTYHVSLKCPFDYCKPHSTQTNLSNPDLQCQFSRCGVLCGHCQPGLSTVFGSSQCKICSNIFLLIIVPISLAGVIVVFVLFLLNLTVTNGNINAFLLYVNIVSIIAPIFLPTQNGSNTFTHLFISVANLDLGIETCFYNGMDDYVKMWLQLIFPIYITFIAITLIITSRYSSIIQRLTARRALPILATLFLLSYTKILRTVCSVMFFYSTITHLPSRHTTLVWLVDASVPLFGVKFTILFAACLLLFLVLLPFNAVLLFTRTLSHLKFINHFKPLLDAFQGAYKDKFHYWTGLQLSLRAVFFGASALDRSTSLIVSIIIVTVMISLHGYVQPYKKKVNNILELFLLLNLQVLLVLSVYNTPNIITVNILIGMVFVQMSCITLKHVQQYLLKRYCDMFMHKANKYLLCFKTSSPKTNTQSIQLSDTVPDVTHRYDEYQEPLIAVD